MFICVHKYVDTVKKMERENFTNELEPTKKQTGSEQGFREAE